ncbi:glycosyltransferase family 2 protein [Candidatus Pelagibacter sp.]|nr:glycosyltransferase family 2 protein [Candidatus Pelagibacter sp.]
MINESFSSIEKLKDIKIEGGLRTKNIFKKAEVDKPLITIITAVLNNQEYLEESILSLHNQKYDNYEHIILDGGSSDKTIEIIKKYENKIDYWCSGKDKGIYDAFNNGMKLAKGDYIGFLNSDDYYSNDTLDLLTKYIKNNPKKDFIFGAVKKHWGVLYGYRPYKIYWSWGFYSSHSTGFFIKTSSAKKVGLYNLKYKYSSDYDYFFRMIVKKKLQGIGTKKEEVFGTFRRGGYSSTINFFDHFKEEIQIRLDNGQNKILILIIFIYKYLRNISKI